MSETYSRKEAHKKLPILSKYNFFKFSPAPKVKFNILDIVSIYRKISNALEEFLRKLFLGQYRNEPDPRDFLPKTDEEYTQRFGWTNHDTESFDDTLTRNTMTKKYPRTAATSELASPTEDTRVFSTQPILNRTALPTDLGVDTEESNMFNTLPEFKAPPKHTTSYKNMQKLKVQFTEGLSNRTDVSPHGEYGPHADVSYPHAPNHVHEQNNVPQEHLDIPTESYDKMQERAYQEEIYQEETYQEETYQEETYQGTYYSLETNENATTERAVSEEDVVAYEQHVRDREEQSQFTNLNTEEMGVYVKQININVLDVAEYFLNKAIGARNEYDHRHTVTHMKLNFLIYYVQAWHLAAFRRPLFKCEFEAFNFGVRCKQICDAYKYFGSKPIPKYTGEVFLDRIISEESLQLVNDIWQIYSSYTETQLYNIVKGELPWQIAFFESDDKIVQWDVMGEYYFRKSQQVQYV